MGPWVNYFAYAYLKNSKNSIIDCIDSYIKDGDEKKCKNKAIKPWFKEHGHEIFCKVNELKEDVKRGSYMSEGVWISDDEKFLIGTHKIPLEERYKDKYEVKQKVMAKGSAPQKINHYFPSKRIFDSCLNFEHVNEGKPDDSVSEDECEDYTKKNNKTIKFVTQDDIPSGCSYNNNNDGILYYNDTNSDIMCGKKDDDSDEEFICLQKKKKRKDEEEDEEDDEEDEDEDEDEEDEDESFINIPKKSNGMMYVIFFILLFVLFCK
jgi:hypothetical protein